MDINIYVLFGILVIHWFADFVLQSDEDAKNKSTNILNLTSHVFQYSLVWGILSVLYWGYFVLLNSTLANTTVLLFGPITFMCHFATDYYTSKANKMLYDSGNTHGFFVSIGFDQLLHYIQLILTYKLLIQ